MHLWYEQWVPGLNLALANDDANTSSGEHTMKLCIKELYDVFIRRACYFIFWVKKLIISSCTKAISTSTNHGINRVFGESNMKHAQYFSFKSYSTTLSQHLQLYFANSGFKIAA